MRSRPDTRTGIPLDSRQSFVRAWTRNGLVGERRRKPLLDLWMSGGYLFANTRTLCWCAVCVYGRQRRERLCFAPVCWVASARFTRRRLFTSVIRSCYMIVGYHLSTGASVCVCATNNSDVCVVIVVIRS
jgi:hypothetical protein